MTLERHYFLNDSREEFVAGKRVRFAGYARNTKTGPVVENDQKSYAVQGLHAWPLLERNRKVTVFGIVSRGPAYAITKATYDSQDGKRNNTRAVGSANGSVLA